MNLPSPAPLLGWVYTNFFLVFFTAMVVEIASYIFRRKRVRVKKYDKYPSAFCEAINIGNQEVILKSHGVTTFDRKSDREWFDQWDKELKPQARTLLPIKDWGDLLLWHLRYSNGMIYYVYVKDNDDKTYRHYPIGRVRSWLKRFFYWASDRTTDFTIDL